ncbi:MAG: UDP-3-O-(3-hydroxymyristoyl)glucosamine N-acyltransferase [bacterium]
MTPLKDIVSKLSLTLVSGFSDDLSVSGIGSLTAAKDDQISFIASPKYIKFLAETKACAVIMDYESIKQELPPEIKFVILDSKNPYLAFAQASQLFYKPYQADAGEFNGQFFADKTSVIGKNTVLFPGVFVDKDTKVGDNCRIMGNSVIGKNVIIGNNVTLYPNVTVYDNSKIGNNCIIHAGSVIGSDGFGYAKDKTGYVKIIHSGYVELEDGVEIGANVTIDRGAVDFTRIGSGTKIDNLVQIAHNVIIGKNCAIAAQTGIAGSSTVGDNVTMGGQVGIAGHISIGNNVTIAAQSGVANSTKDNEVLSGSPAFYIKDWRNSAILFKKLPELFKKMKEITKLKDLKNE